MGRYRLTRYLRDHPQQVTSRAFLLLPLLIGLSYWLIRGQIAEQEAEVTVTISTLSVALVVSLYLIGYGMQRLIERHLVGRHWAIRWSAWAGAILLVFLYLEAMGYGVRGL